MVTEWKLAEQTLKDLLRFERLLSDLSARFVNIVPDEVDKEIKAALEQVLEFFQVDRCGLLGISPDGKKVHVTHAAYAEGIGRVSGEIDLAFLFPWSYEKLVQGQPISFAGVEELPETAEQDRINYIALGILSVLDIPLFFGGRLAFIIVLNSVRRNRSWPGEYIPRLRLLGEILINALERRKVYEELQKREAALRNNEKDIRQLVGRLISAQEEELRRLSRELHDDLTQRLAVIAIEAGKLELELRSMAGTSPDVAEKLDLIKNQLIKASEDVHHISRQLHPSILDDLGLVRAIESECEILLRQEGIRITFIKDGEFSAVDKDVALCLYRIIQEGLKNIAKHSQARRAEIFLHNDGECINLTVRDKGIGFDPHEKRQKPGLGLSSMRERIQLVCGEFSIETRPGQGTIIRVSIPQRRCGV